MSDYDDLLFDLERLEPETMPLSSKESLKTAASALRTLLRARENWRETAEQQMRNADFYRGIVCEVGDLFGDAAKTADDGTIMEDVLALVVPGLVEKLLRERNEMQSHIDALQARVHLCAGYEQLERERDEARAEVERLWAEIKRQDKFIAAAFDAHPNLDRDIEIFTGGRSDG